MTDEAEKPPVVAIPQPAAKPVAERPRAPAVARAKEIGGPAGPEPTRYGDWEQKGRCTDF